MSHDPGSLPDVSDRPSPLRWPPPGLERIQGDLWGVTGRLLAGGSVLVLPLLVALAVPETFGDARVGGAAWFLAATTAAGLAVLLTAFVGCFRLLRRAAKATGEGYGWILVALAAADRPRDTGFLLQGARAFSTLSPPSRRRLLGIRLAKAAAAFFAGLWLPVGFAVGLLLAAAGFTATGGFLAALTLWPTGLALVGAVVLGAWEGTVLRRARRAWYTRSWAADLTRGEIDQWLAGFQELDPEGRLGPGSVRARGPLSAGAVAALLLAVLVLVPPAFLVGLSSLSTIVAGIATPQLQGTVLRYSETELFRPLRTATDPSVSPDEAGEAFHAILLSGREVDVEAASRPPARHHPEPWISEADENPLGIAPRQWPADLLPATVAGLDDEAVQFLTDVSGHPAVEELELLARAPGLDVTSARWNLPFPEGTQPRWEWDLSYSERAAALRGASHVQLARAALAVHEGRPDDAELLLRELVSAGFLLADESLHFFDNVIGLQLVRTGAAALESLYAATGRSDALEDLQRGRDATERARAPLLAVLGAGELDAARDLPALVTDPSVPRGVRWELFESINSVLPCLSPQRIAFGAGEEYRTWLEEARDALVRSPAEEALFEISQLGFFGRAGMEDLAPGSCWSLLRAVGG